MRKFLYLFTTVFLSLGLFFAACDEDDIPDGPSDDEQTLFYVAGEAGGLVKVFNVEQKAFTDSFTIDSIPSDKNMRIWVLGDDEELVASYAEGTYIYDLKTREITRSYSDYGKMIVAPDGNLFLANNLTNNRWDFRLLSDMSLVYSHPSEPFLPQFSQDSKMLSFLAPNSETGNWDLILYDLNRDSLIAIPRKFNEDRLNAFYSYPIHSKGTIFFHGWNSYGNFACMAYVDSQNVTVLKAFSRGSGMVPIVDPDGEYLYFTNTPSWDMWEPEVLYVYEIDSGDSVATIDLSDLHEPALMRISYDGKYILSSPFYPEWLGHDPNSVALINVESYIGLGTYDFGRKPFWIATKTKIN